MQMSAVFLVRSRRWRMIALVVGVVFALAPSVFAQRGGGMGHDPGRPKDPGKPVDDSPVGTASGWIMSYAVPSTGEDEDILAILKFKPLGKKTVPVKVQVPRGEPVEIILGERTDFEPEEYADVLAKGLYCRFTWRLVSDKEDNGDKGSSKPKAKAKELTRVEFDPLEVNGKIVEVKDDMVTIRGKPKNDQRWPDDPSLYNTPSQGGGLRVLKIKPVTQKSVKLRVWEGASKFVDAEGNNLDPTEFVVGQDVDARIIYGRKSGIALKVTSKTASGGSDEDDRKADSGGSRG